MVGDVSGYGMVVGLLMVIVNVMFKFVMDIDLWLVFVFEMLNCVFYCMGDVCVFMMFFYGVFDVCIGDFDYVIVVYFFFILCCLNGDFEEFGIGVLLLGL